MIITVSKKKQSSKHKVKSFRGKFLHRITLDKDDALFLHFPENPPKNIFATGMLKAKPTNPGRMRTLELRVLEFKRK